MSTLDTDESPTARAEALEVTFQIRQALMQFDDHMQKALEAGGLIGAKMLLDMLHKMAETERDRDDPLQAAELFLQPRIDLLTTELVLAALLDQL